MDIARRVIFGLLATLISTAPVFASAQDTANTDDEFIETQETSSDEQSNQPIIEQISAGPSRDVLAGQPLSFNLDVEANQLSSIKETLWDFGDGVMTTGSNVDHTYESPGTYEVALRVTTDDNEFTDTTQVRAYKHLAILVSDTSASAQQIKLHQQRAASENILVLALQVKGGGPEVLVEEELTRQLVDTIPNIEEAHLIIMWTSGGVGANVLTKFAQHIKQSEGIQAQDLAFNSKGIILLSDTPYGVLKPTAQSTFNQLKPSYVLLARPEVLDSILATTTAEDAKAAVITSPLEFRLIGTFSARTVAYIRITNIVSFGINFLVNRGVPINSLILILMLPIIATILAFARQVIGIKAFGLITPAMTTLSFLVMGLRYGLIVFITILLAGTLTRMVLRRLRLLYLPRMALVLTSVSLSLLFLLALGVSTDRNSILSFSIFPALILTILAEEFIAAQFKQGFRSALTITAWTLVLATICYGIVSSEILRTLILSYPEIVLATIPINIILGQWSGLRVTEYFRFRTLLRYGKPSS